jgi:hypothetical protein
MGDTLEFRNDFRVAVAVAAAVLRRPGGAILLPYVCRNGESSPYLKYTVETITVIEMIQTLRQINAKSPTRKEANHTPTLRCMIDETNDSSGWLVLSAVVVVEFCIP